MDTRNAPWGCPLCPQRGTSPTRPWHGTTPPIPDRPHRSPGSRRSWSLLTATPKAGAARRAAAGSRAAALQSRGRGARAAPGARPSPHLGHVSLLLSKSNVKVFLPPRFQALSAPSKSGQAVCLFPKYFVYAARTNPGSLGNAEPSYGSRRRGQTPPFPVKAITQEELPSAQQHPSFDRTLACNAYSRERFPWQVPKVGNVGWKNLRAAGRGVLRGFGKRQEALGVLRQGKGLTASACARAASPSTLALPKANGRQGKAGGKSTEQPAPAGQPLGHGASPAEPPAARQPLGASLLAALFTSAGISHLPSPSRRARARVGRCQGNRSPGEDSLR